ncbi:MAG: hypothetical protein KKG86_00500 [Gammaproteobacteria bacterium]|nr:hypothetical protein [Gammaproteobacteria bacterium]
MSNIPADPLLRIKKLSDSLENNEFENTNALIFAFRQEKDLLSELPAVFEGALESIWNALKARPCLAVKAARSVKVTCWLR